MELDILTISLICWTMLSGGQSCIDTPDVNQIGNATIGRGRLARVSSAMFSCSGRVTSIAANMTCKNASGDLPIIQIWRPTSLNSSVYNRIGQVQFTNTTRVAKNHHCTNITISNNCELKFRPGDVIGYYQSSNSQCDIWNICAIGYTSYVSNTSNASTTTTDVMGLTRNYQPLIKMTFDIRCDNLSTPSNGEITSCSSGREGVGYEGDTCSFTCNTSYERTGSNNRTCQSDGSWSGGEIMCNKVSDGEDFSGGLPIPIIAGTAGGVLAVLLCVGVICVKWLRRRKVCCLNAVVDSAQGHDKNTKSQSTLSSSTFYCSLKTRTAPPTYENTTNYTKSDYAKPQDCLTLIRPSVTIEDSYSQPHHNSAEEERLIYANSCDERKDYGPIYTDPPTKVEKIYELFEGKRFRKLYHKDVKIVEHFGCGEFGIVTHGFLSNVTDSNVEIAVKNLSTDTTDKDKLRFLQEAAIMCQFDHENVIKLYGVVTEDPAMIVFEYTANGNLRNYLHTLQSSIQEADSKKLPILLLTFCQEIAAGMAYFSGKQFIHKDLTASNILVSGKHICKIADFSMSRDLIDETYYNTSQQQIAVKWTAPEALHYRKYSIQSDIWSYGCVLYEIWSLGHTPFGELSNAEVLEKVDTGYRLPPPPGCPRTIYRMMIKCWHPDPRSRPQFGQITKLLAGNGNYLLGWSDEDKQVAGEDGMKLGAPLECSENIYCDLQFQYNQ